MWQAAKLFQCGQSTVVFVAKNYIIHRNDSLGFGSTEVVYILSDFRNCLAVFNLNDGFKLILKTCP